MICHTLVCCHINTTSVHYKHSDFVCSSSYCEWLLIQIYSIEVMRKDHVQAACRRPKRPRSAGVAKEMKSSKEVHVPGIISRRKFPVSLLRSSSVLYKGLLYER